jgi:hypothetical protein
MYSLCSEKTFYIKDIELGPNQYLYHGSPSLFELPYTPRQIDNRYSPALIFPRYWATKSCGEGYVYEYRIKPEYNNIIPKIVFMCGPYRDMKKSFDALVASKPDMFNFTLNELTTGKAHPGSLDVELAQICKKEYNGVYLPSMENQILLCSNDRPQWLEINRIYLYNKNNDVFSFTILKDFSLSKAASSISLTQPNMSEPALGSINKVSYTNESAPEQLFAYLNIKMPPLNNNPWNVFVDLRNSIISSNVMASILNILIPSKTFRFFSKRQSGPGCIVFTDDASLADFSCKAVIVYPAINWNPLNWPMESKHFGKPPYERSYSIFKNAQLNVSEAVLTPSPPTLNIFGPKELIKLLKLKPAI